MSVIRRQDIFAALLFIVIAALIIWVAIPLGVDEPKKVKFQALSPSYYPRLVGYCLLAFGIPLLLRQLLFRSEQSQDEKTGTGYRRNAFAILLLVAVVLFVYFWFLNSLGFVLMSTITLAILQIIAGERSPVVIVLISLTVPLMLYFFFAKVANIPIPSGVLEPILLRF